MTVNKYDLERRGLNIKKARQDELSKFDYERVNTLTRSQFGVNNINSGSQVVSDQMDLLESSYQSNLTYNEEMYQNSLLQVDAREQEFKDASQSNFFGSLLSVGSTVNNLLSPSSFLGKLIFGSLGKK